MYWQDQHPRMLLQGLRQAKDQWEISMGHQTHAMEVYGYSVYPRDWKVPEVAQTIQKELLVNQHWRQVQYLQDHWKWSFC